MPIPLPEATTSPVSSDDELAAPVQLSNKTLPRVSDDSDEYDTPDGHRSITDLDSESDSLAGVGHMFHDSTEKSRNRSSKSEPADGPLLRPGEGIVVDWSEEMYDALFGGDHRDPYSLRGAPTWTSCEHLPDPELAKRREKRQGRKKRGITLHECLDEFGKEEILSENDAWYCPRCKEHRRASKKFELWKTPDILVMHLKRFSANRGFRDKLDVLVDFPIEELDLTDRVVANDGDESLVYDLFAVDNHYGGLGGGHYTAYAKNFFTDEWNEYNGEFGENNHP
jgi:ubiquitin carboxyl-terminal hydrolase 4/11